MAKSNSSEPFAKSERAKKKRRGCCGCTFVFIVIIPGMIALVGLLLADSIFNIHSNLYYLAYNKSDTPLKVGTDNGWVTLEDLSGVGMKKALWERGTADGFRHSTIALRREPQGKRQRLATSLFDSELNVIEFSPGEFEFDLYYERNPDAKTFQPLNASRAFRAAQALATSKDEPPVAFAINLNYYTPGGQPLGLVIHNGVPLNSEVKSWSGFFFVEDGVPRFGARSLYEEAKGQITVAAQAFPSVMKNGKVFSYMEKDPERYFNGLERTYRSLVGTRGDGTVVFINSGDGGILNMKELTRIANLLEIQNATLLDGGRALQYELDHQGDTMSFNAFNNTFDDPQLKKRNFAPERPPVYLIVKEKE